MSGGDLPTASAVGLMRVGLQTACDAVGFAFQFGPWVGESENDRPTITMIPLSIDHESRHQNTDGVLATKIQKCRFELWDVNLDLIDLTESFLVTNIKTIAGNWYTLGDVDCGPFAHDQWGFRHSWDLGFRCNLNRYNTVNYQALINLQLGRYARKH